MKIFNEDSYEFFKKESLDYINKNKKENIDKINLDDKRKLEEINNYYKRYYFESKKNDINLIENYTQNNIRHINYELYLKDLDEAKKMNERYNIINYLLNTKDKKNNAKNELEMNQIIQKWEKLEKMILDKKTKKMRIDDKKVLIEYFDDENNKDSLIKIFGKDAYESFKKITFNKNKKF